MPYQPADFDDRLDSANREFETFDFSKFTVEDSSPWSQENFDGDLTKTVYFSNPHPMWEDTTIYRPTLKGTFTVKFLQGTDAVMDVSCTVNGNEILPNLPEY